MSNLQMVLQQMFLMLTLWI